MSAVQPSTSIGEILAEFGGEVKTGPFGTALKASEYTSFGVPVISVGEIGHGVIQIHDRTPLVDDAVLSRLPEYVLREGDIVFARKGSVERTALIGKREAGWFLGSDGIRLRLPNTVSSRFVRYWISSPTVREWLTQNSTGSTMASLNQATIKRLPISLPSLSMQKAIASTLGALDDKIELNRRMSETLEEMARALYRSWFVDFDPVHARALGQPPAHMDATTAALFPDSFGPDGLPKGWEETSLDAIADFLNGAALQKFPAQEGEDWLPVIKIAELRGGLTAKSNKAGLKVPAKYKIKNGDVLFSWSGSLLQKVWTEGPGALNQHLFKVTSDIVPKWFHFFAVDQHMDEFRQIAASKATTMGHIQRHHLKEALVAMPTDRAVIDAADRILGPLFERAFSADLECHQLAALRDTLLPRLMSGELRIREAEKQVEEVV